MLPGRTAVDFGLAQAASFGQMADVETHTPHIIVREGAVRGWHTRGVDAVFDVPFERAIGVGLYFRTG